MNDYSKGGFTLPGEAGYEALTLKMAEKWGADVIRDSDGTKLSDEITKAGYRIYSTICIIREHNAFAEAHPDAQQQSFLFSKPTVAAGDTLEIRPLDGYFTEQFELNDSTEAMGYWQVWDRTSNRLLGTDEWEYLDGVVKIQRCEPFHRYSVSFLAWRVWEEINMYNHTTNHWTSEHLRQLDPRHPLAWEYLKQWLRDWCENNPQTDVVRLTSLFYNFVWIFGDDMRLRSRFVDWASYDFTVSPAALKAFEEEYGYALTAEDFINKGLLQATHRPPTRAKKDYMDFIQRFVAEKAKALVDIIHAYGKQAYVFYDDSWVGMEPCGKYFPSIGFDGLIKCVFSGFECRLCALAKVETHELRFHPYLFPVGLGGLPTFSEGGEPEKDAISYWLHVRRALARQTVQRIGLGGYLHLTIGQDKFNDAIAGMA
ncbi:MAG: D-galactosyl-beta-1-4-L-rhamnose phosphorylase, partial [Clostridia bacterium]|nr:D-galactosyl-beta-1-4-L-rhamnose phosphorylase [Clostridia bacterium]